MKTILSYPRSGNHLVRFFIEILTETPTLGCIDNNKDLPLCLNTYPEKIHFDIKTLDNYEKDNLYRKHHNIPRNSSELIFIVRNPKEVLLRHLNYKYRLEGWDGYNNYFNLINYYNNFKKKKILFYYEDIIINKVKFIKDLYDYLGIDNKFKLKYVIDNIDNLFELSKQGTGRDWGGVNSNNIHFYYDKIDEDNKIKFDNYLEYKISSNKYDIIKEKYNL